jgi:hypothetical protein
MKSKDEWDSQNIDFEESPIHRLYTFTDDYTLCLHKWSKSKFKSKDPFYHNHPWQFAAMIVKGGYETYVGTKNKPCGPFVLKPFSYYASSTLGEWHSVKPYETTYSILVYGKDYKYLSWDFTSNDTEAFSRLSSRQSNDIWSVFRNEDTQSEMKKSIRNKASERDAIYSMR